MHFGVAIRHTRMTCTAKNVHIKLFQEIKYQELMFNISDIAMGAYCHTILITLELVKYGWTMYHAMVTRKSLHTVVIGVGEIIIAHTTTTCLCCVLMILQVMLILCHLCLYLSVSIPNYMWKKLMQYFIMWWNYKKIQLWSNQS